MLVEERNTSQLIHAVERILENPEAFSKQGRTASRQRMVGHYDIGFVAQCYDALFQECLDGHVRD